MAQIDNIKKERISKINSLKKLGVNPYPSQFDKDFTIDQVIKKEGEKIKTAGKIMSFRTHGNIAFVDIQDDTGKIQIFFQKSLLEAEAYKNLKLLDIGDYIGVEGKVMHTVAGEISIAPESYTLLAKSLRPLPHEWYGLKDVETRYRKRYLDLLINKDTQRVISIRTKIISLLREFLDKNGFFEVETPILQTIYGGASAKPFITHHNALDCDLYLRIADELYLKRLIVAGYEKVYEIGKDFRNEGLSRSHNPEFTQLEFYWAYHNYESLMDFTEELFCFVIGKINKTLDVSYSNKIYNFKRPWKRITYRDLIKKYMNFDINEINTEDKLKKLIKEKKLLEDEAVGYGLLLDKLYKKHIRPKLSGPLFLIDHPIELKPLAKRKDNDDTKAASFQLLVAGEEFINAYNELNDPQDQKKRWESEKELASRGSEDYQIMDEDYIEALEYGMPPTAGWGLGVDRLVAFLTNKHSIKDVIIFPTLRPQ